MKIRKILNNLKNNIFIISLFSFFWFLLRSGQKPSRAVYPCQKAAIAQFSSYFIFTYPIVDLKRLLHFFKYSFSWKTVAKTIFLVISVFFLVSFISTTYNKTVNFNNIEKLKKHKKHLPIGVGGTAGVLLGANLSQAATTAEIKVVSIYDPNATNWDHVTGLHWEYIDQNVVNNMMEQGVMTLTDTSNPMSAWSALIPYNSGDNVAIKLNFNNSYSCDGAYDQDIDSYSETTNAVIDGLISIGVPADNIWIYDAMLRVVPNRFIAGIDNQDVRFYGRDDYGMICDGNYYQTSFVAPDSPDVSGFTCDQGNLPLDVIRPAQVLVDADHLINIPLFKSHGTYVTLALKNHYGSATYDLNDKNTMHNYFNQGNNSEGCDLETENILADINNNPHIRDKTRLVIGEGIYGNAHTNWQSVERWDIFANDDPNIYFFSTDPVAISSVMTDYIMEERGWQDHEQLHAGALIGLGIHDHWDNFSSKQYTAFEYIAIDLTAPSLPDITVTDSVVPSDDMLVAFGNVTAGTSLDQTVTIANDGLANLSIGNIAQVNQLTTPFSIFNDTCSGQNIMPSGTCFFNLRFSPIVTSSYSDSFDVPSNDADENPVIITVNGAGFVNMPPTAVDDAASTPEDTAVGIDVLSNDTDTEGDTLTVASVTQGSNGAVVNNGSDVTYTPAADFAGTDTFTYVATDGFDNSSPATVSVLVTTGPNFKESYGGGCFIATAAYGSYEASHVITLRLFRDKFLLTNEPGRWFVKQYYSYSPAAADWIRDRDEVKWAVRLLLYPLVVCSWILLTGGPLLTVVFSVLPLFSLLLLTWYFIRRAT